MKVLITREKNHDFDEEKFPPDFSWIHLPLIETLYLAGDAMKNQSIRAKIDAYEYILFTSGNAVIHFSQWLEEQGAEKPRNPKIVCIGEKTARVAEADGWTVFFSPMAAHASEELLQEWMQRPLVNRKVLFPRAKETREIVRRTLESKGAWVDELFVYETRTKQSSRETLRLLTMEKMDWISFFSPSGVRAFFELLGESTAIDWIQRSKTRIASIGRVTTAAIEKYDLNVSVECAKPSMRDLCERMVEWERSVV